LLLPLPVYAADAPFDPRRGTVRGGLPALPCLKLIALTLFPLHSMALKYGKYYTQYKKQVPYTLIPGLI